MNLQIQKIRNGIPKTIKLYMRISLSPANNLDDIVLASTNYINEDLKHSRKDKFIEFARGDVLIRVGDNDYSAKVIVGFTGGKEMVLYDIINFTPTEFSIKKERTHQGYAQAGSPRKDVSSG